jgi:hypothetical protein
MTITRIVFLFFENAKKNTNIYTKVRKLLELINRDSCDNFIVFSEKGNPFQTLLERVDPERGTDLSYLK